MPMITQDLEAQHRRTFKERWNRAQEKSQFEIDRQRREATLTELKARMPLGVLNAAVDNGVTMIICKRAA